MKKLFASLLVGLVGITVVAPVAFSSPTSSPWHLDRINQRSAPLDGNVDFGVLNGAGINIYIVDSGVRPTHEQFGGRVIAGIDPVSSSGESVVNPRSNDCDGHGTHVAALAAGSTVGVARGATVIAVRALNCDGDGTVDNVVAALKWIRSHHVSGKLAIVNLSLGVDRNDDGAAIDKQVQELLAEGIVVTVAAGNGDQDGFPYDSCEISPGHNPGAITVGSSTISGAAALYSNQGACIDLFAPGGDLNAQILSAWKSFDNEYSNEVGTSMASPLVAGYAALLAQQQPGLCATQVSDAIIQRATPNVLSGVAPSTPNRLLFVDTSVVAPTIPGQASNVITTVSSGSVLVSWEPPCNGGADLTKTTVSIFRGSTLVQRRNLDAGASVVRFNKLQNGVQYRVQIQHHNAIGDGAPTARWKTVNVRPLRSGQTIPVRSIGRFAGDLNMKWKVASSSRNVCKVLSNPTSIRFLKIGTCRIAIRTNAGGVPAIHNLRVN